MPSSRSSSTRSSSSSTQNWIVRLCKRWTKQEHALTLLFLGTAATVCAFCALRLPVHTMSLLTPGSSDKLPMRIAFYLSGPFEVQDPGNNCNEDGLAERDPADHERLQEMCEKMVGEHVNHKHLYKQWCSSESGKPPLPLTCADIDVFYITGFWTHITTVLNLGITIPATLFFAHSAHAEGAKSFLHMQFDYFIFCLLVVTVFVQTMSVLIHLCLIQSGSNKRGDSGVINHPVSIGWALIVFVFALLAQWAQIVVCRSTCPNLVRQLDDQHWHHSPNSAHKRLEASAYSDLVKKMDQSNMPNYGTLKPSRGDAMDKNSVDKASAVRSVYQVERAARPGTPRRERAERSDRADRAARSERPEQRALSARRNIEGSPVTPRKNPFVWPPEASPDTSSTSSFVDRPRAHSTTRALNTPTPMSSHRGYVQMDKTPMPSHWGNVKMDAPTKNGASSGIKDTWDSLQAQVYNNRPPRSESRGASVPRVRDNDAASKRSIKSF